ncbi:MAG: sigma-54-dependent Fis family transcriptional regulator [Bacteroidales bacterium]|nr:sigma-54-dependent Fis family transcriptional regulator [Bacteroidales bacterium]
MVGPFKIFIVEDDLIFAKILTHHLSLHEDHEVEIYTNGKDVLRNLYKQPNMISLDINLPDINGLEVLKKIKEFDKNLPVVVVSGQNDVSTAVELLKIGVYDYIVKEGDSKERLWNISKNIREHQHLKRRVSALEEEVEKKFKYGNLIKGESLQIKKIFSLIEKAVSTNITVSITGETGTGKELVAKSIHYNSDRRKYPFVALNVSAIPKELIESELFGHEKGSFTGATATRIGKFEQANKGTIFLDEIGDMDLNMQAKLLRVIQEEELIRVGSNKKIDLDTRIIVATHKNLREEVKAGRFREDLYFRLLGLPIALPPLRDRENDIILLARYFVEEFSKKNNMPIKIISPDAINKLRKYPYPGNIRELKAILDLASVMANNDIITEEDIMFSSADSISSLLVEEKSLEEYNQMIIQHFMLKYDNKVRQVAQKLGIGKTTIYRMMKEDKL